MLGAMIVAVMPAGAWQPGYPDPSKPMATTGFKINTKNRDEVVAFWHAVYAASFGYQDRMKWTGSLEEGNPGSTSQAFAGDVERRINYFRAMCGIPAGTRVNTGSTVVVSDQDPYRPPPQVTKQAAAQQAATLIAASYDPLTGALPGMSHNPDPGLAFWSEAAWNAAANGNLAFGTFGPRAVTEYVVETLLANASTSEWNSLVGHRRWVLLPRATDFATGDFPGTSLLQPPTNVLYVSQSAEENQPVLGSPFVAYPPAGYFPVNLNARFWSLSRRGADFSRAKVVVRDAAGKKMKATNVHADNSYGNPALIWEMDGKVASVTTAADRKYQVLVTGIVVDGLPVRHEYEVILINPDLIRKTTPVIGKRKVGVRSRTRYKLKRVSGAHACRVIEYRRVNTLWAENGEGKKPKVIDRTSPAYPLLVGSSGYPGSGAIEGRKSFNLTFPVSYDIVARGVPEQIMELDTWFQTSKGSVLSFQYSRGLMSNTSACAVEVSDDQGSSWEQVGTLILGNDPPSPDKKNTSVSLALPKSGKPLRIRFRYYFTEKGGAIATHEDAGGFPTGIFIDHIGVDHCEWFEPRKVKLVGGKSYVFKLPKKAKAGEKWALSMESEFGGGWLPVGPFRSVKIVGK